MKEPELDGAADYGDNCAEFYDEIYSTVDPRIIKALTALGNNGRVLELGVGTGRVALPLTAAGVDVSGIEASAAMLNRLRAKAGADDLLVSRGNFAQCEIEGRFSLVYSLVSTFFLLASAEEQQQCFSSVARVLDERGVFLLENYEAGLNSNDRVAFHTFSQTVGTSVGLREYRGRICYASPARLDEMASIAGMRLRDRCGDWTRRPYAPNDPLHISLYELK